MRKYSIISFLFLFFIFSAYISASPLVDFDKTTDFSITLKKLAKLAEDGKTASVKGKFLILDGALSSYTVIDKDPGNYTVELLLVNGEWEGVSEVHIFRTVVIVKGKEYAEKFPAKRRRKKSKKTEIPLNSGLIVVGKLNNVINMGEAAVPVIKGYYLRVFK